MLDRFGGITGFDWLSDPNGTYVRVNPLRDNGRTDSDVTAFRHVLVEFTQMLTVPTFRSRFNMPRC